MRYNGLNNMFFSLCQINDNHSFTSSSHTKKTKSYNYSKHHKNTLIDNKALSLGNDSNLLIVFYVQIMPDDLVMQLHRF
ncbi:pentapeptide repeat-containing protein [Escherichia coli]|nr:pentapeptide repeat-containing protein [Escherichia coli]CTW52617.1 pentapeptide repeat-containing protein [Escherichia coli]